MGNEFEQSKAICRKWLAEVIAQCGVASPEAWRLLCITWVTDYRQGFRNRREAKSGKTISPLVGSPEFNEIRNRLSMAFREALRNAKAKRP